MSDQQTYINLFQSQVEAVQFEHTIMSGFDASCYPTVAKLVLNNKELTDNQEKEYFTFLIEQWNQW